MAAVEVAALVVSAGASVYEGVSSYEAQTKAAELQEEQIKTSENTARAKAAEDQLTRDQQLEAVQSQQKAAAAANGMALSSGTLSSLEENSYNNFARDNQIANTNLQLMEAQSEMQIDATKAQLSQQHTSDWISGVTSLANTMGSMASVLTVPSSAASTAESTSTQSTNSSVSGWGGWAKSDPNTFSGYASRMNRYYAPFETFR